MSITEQIYAQARVMVGDLTAEQDALLQVLCQAATAGIMSRLRSGIEPEDCRADFVAAGSLLALAALSEGDGSPERFTAGDLTIQRGSGCAASRCLRSQAELILMPYVRDGFSFRGV